MSRPETAAKVLAELFRRSGFRRRLGRARIVIAWNEVAGRELSRFTRASGFRDGILYVDTTDSETAAHLALERMRFVEGFRSRGIRELKDIRFRAGRVVPEEETPPAPRGEADPGELAALKRGLGSLELEPELAASALRAAESVARSRAARRELGWEACRVCGLPAQGGRFCVICSRYAQAPGVKRAARLLQAEPRSSTAWLTEDERATALFLAAEELHGELLALLPQVIADGRLRGTLELKAAAWLCLMTGRGPGQLTEEDWLLLPPRVLRVLGRA